MTTSRSTRCVEKLNFQRYSWSTGCLKILVTSNAKFFGWFGFLIFPGWNDFDGGKIFSSWPVVFAQIVHKLFCPFQGKCPEKNIQLVCFLKDKSLRTNSEPESIVSVKLKKVESKEKAGKGDDGPWQSGILFCVFDLFQGWDLFFHFFAFLGTLHEFEPLPHAEGHGEGEHGEDGVDIAEASKNDVSQLLHNAFWRILSMQILSSDFFKTPAPAVLLGSSWRLPQKSGRATTRPGLTRKKRQIWLLHSFCLHFKGVLVQPI